MLGYRMEGLVLQSRAHARVCIHERATGSCIGMTLAGLCANVRSSARLHIAAQYLMSGRAQFSV